MTKSKKTNKTDQNFYEFLQSTAGDLSHYWPDRGQLSESIPELKNRFSQLAVSAATYWKLTRSSMQPSVKHVALIAQQFASDTAPIIGAAFADSLRLARSAGTTLTSKSARKIYQVVLSAAIATGVVAAVMMTSATYAVYAGDLASPQMLLAKKNTGTTLLDRNGKVLYQVYGANNRKLIQLDQVPKPMVQATLAAEDPDFYQHAGFSIKGTARAIYQDIVNHSKVQGGSTITQQLVKNALLTPGKSFTRKYQELVLASELEHKYSKDEILQMYLNEIYYGQGSYGIESASQTYFHKSSKDLSISESALLAGLPLCPGTCDPNVDPGAALGRRNFILDRMSELGYINADQLSTAKAVPIQASARQVEIHAPHFVFYVLDQLRQQYGEDLVERGGITVYTTLDLAKQQTAEQIVKTQIEHLQYNHATNGGLISMEPSTGEILSMVGSVDYNAPDFGNVNVTLSDLQPGSSFKPFVYLESFTKGYNGATVVDDLPVSLPSGDGTVYQPKDYDLRYRGKNIRLRRALANSLNIPAIHVLQFAGIHDSITMAHNLGITTLNDESRYGLSLVLGGGEVKMIDMATAYGVFANGGVKVPPRSIMRVLDRTDHDITKPVTTPPQNVVDPRLAYMLTNILSDNSARTEEFGANSPLKLEGYTAAAKTGTTNDFRDNWTVGYTPGVVTAVWVGNNDHSAMYNVDGITGAAPIWHNYMLAVLKGTPDKPFTRPAGLVTQKVCAADGGLANPWDQSIDEVFLAEKPQTKHCSSAPPAPPKPAEPSPEDAAKAAEAALKAARDLNQTQQPPTPPTAPVAPSNLPPSSGNPDKPAKF